MASNVFGSPVTNSTVKALNLGARPLRVDRARMALEMMNSDEKANNARQHAENLKKRYDDKVAGAMCLIYNATRNPVTLVDYHTWGGYPLGSPYPVAIDNGQWGAFFHEHIYASKYGSHCGLVYRGVTDYGSELDWILCWSCSPNASTNTVYTMAGEIPFTPTSTNSWGKIGSQIWASTRTTHQSKQRGCMATAMIGTSPVTVFEGVLTLDGLM